MNLARTGTAGSTRPCPHCKATILESSSVCPACRGHLRFDPEAAQAQRRRDTPLSVEATLRHPADDEVVEYTMLLSIRDERGHELVRHVVGVGALQPGEQRSFSLSVEVAEATGKARGR